MYRNTFVEINLDNIAHNVKTITDNYKYKYYIGVVKGNAYGHGYGIIDTLKKNGINYFAVSNLNEAMEIRKIDKNTPVMCLEPIDIKYMEVCSKNNISICLSNYEYFKELCKLDYKLKIHLKIDSGMNRLGFNNKNQINEVYKYLKNSDNLYLEGIFTHFATSGLFDKNYDNQVDTFKELTSDIDLSSVDVVHLGRSVTMCLHDKIDFANGIRLGIIMYGFEVVPKEDNSFKGKLRKIKWDFIRKTKGISKTIPCKELGLKQAFTLKSEVIEINDVKKGEYIGYGALYQAEEDMKVAIVDVGYADGINRRRNNSKMEINGKLYSVIGGVCMGMTLLKVDDSVKVHDEVIVIGDKVDVKTVSRYIGTTSYETLLLIDSSVERRYV